MLNDKQNDSGPLNFLLSPDIAMNMVENFCSVICRPIEMLLRPWHGTQYFSVPVIFFSSGLMIILPLFSAMATGVISMIPLVHMAPPMGLFGIASLSQLYFLLSLVHGIRIYGLMLHPEREMLSEFEGPALPFFQLLPKGSSFYFVRIVWEPLFVIVAAILLENMFIIQSGLATYLQLAAMALAMKGFIHWYRGWKYIRDIMDAKFAGPIIAKLVDNTASDAELAQVHLASFPKDLPDDIREEAARHIARTLEK